MKNFIDDICEYDSIYRSDGKGYVQFRKYFLTKNQEKLDEKFRVNYYTPLRILLLEATKNKRKHSLKDLWLLLFTRIMKDPHKTISISASEDYVIPWQQMCTAFYAGGPVSNLSIFPNCLERFVFSTIDGILHFCSYATGKVEVQHSLSIPGVSFLNFCWVNNRMFCGFGVNSSLFIVTTEMKVFEIPLSFAPSNVLCYPNQSLLIVAARVGVLYSVDLTDIADSVQTNEDDFFIKPVSTNVTKIEVNVVKFHKSKYPITDMTITASGNQIIYGTSEGEITVCCIELRNIRGWKNVRMELKETGTIRYTVSQIVANIKKAPVDAVSTLRINRGSDDEPILEDYLFLNMRNEYSILFVTHDEFEHLILIRSIRSPSTRAHCPALISLVDKSYICLSGTDMGDLLIAENEDDPLILTFHEEAISSVDWCKNSNKFIAADVSGVISLWTKNEF